MADETRWRFDTDELYVKTPDEMATAFGADSEAVRNSVEIAQSYRFRFRVRQIPFPDFQNLGVPPRELTSTPRWKSCRSQCRDGLDGDGSPRFARAPRATFDESPYYERIDREMPVIRDMGFSGYMLIVADFIDYARGLGIPVGPGRGSVVGSLVSYALGITESIRSSTAAVRALAESRPQSMPDIDVDFCFERRDEVLTTCAKIRRRSRRADHHVRHDQGQTGHSRRRPRARTVVRRDRPIVKLYPAPKQGRDFPLKDALEMEPRLKAEREMHPDLFDYAFKLEGLLRHASRHAAGVVISDMPLADLVPLYVDKERNEDGALDHAVFDEGRRGNRAYQVRLPRTQEPDADHRHARL